LLSGDIERGGAKLKIKQPSILFGSWQKLELPLKRLLKKVKSKK